MNDYSSDSDYILTPDYQKKSDSVCYESSESNSQAVHECLSELPFEESAVPGTLQDKDIPKFVNYMNSIRRCRSVENYKCLNKISEGTYGAVYRALDHDTGEVVALKHIKYHESQWKEGFPVTCLREISILLELKHPNILSVKEIVINDKRDQYYMVMEYVEHELKTLLVENKPDFTLSERKCLLKQLLDGTRFMHENWVMHRDLKTTNILYNNKGILKICDFGMARKFGNPIKNYTHNVVTHWYRAPELFLGQPDYTEKTDIWSVGCIFAEIILGKPIFMGTNDADTLDMIFRLCGSPTEDNWPGYTKLPAIVNRTYSIKSYKPSFHTKFKVGIMGGMVKGSCCMTDLGLDLLKKMLQLDPNKRISAKEALEHPYITREKPRTQVIQLMPTIPDTNCKARTKRKQDNTADACENKRSSRFAGRVDPTRFLSMMEKTKLDGIKF